MTLLNVAPLYRSSVGFDRVLDLLEASTRGQSTDNYPPFDSVKLSEDEYRVTMAVAGFREDDLDITTAMRSRSAASARTSRKASTCTGALQPGRSSAGLSLPNTCTSSGQSSLTDSCRLS
jgi:HSP20 family molecular chaperone IbpA